MVPMVLSVVVLVWKVKERTIADEIAAQDPEEEPALDAGGKSAPMDKAVKRSLLFILFSVALWFMQRLYEGVRDSAYEIIQKKGATYYGIAMAVRRIAECIVRNERSILPVSSLIEGHYGLDGICMGVPTIIGSSGVQKVLDIPLSEEEQQKLTASADALKKVLDTIEL